MKRFFLVFSIMMIIFLILMTGVLAVVKYCAIETYNLRAVFFQGWGITLIPFHGSQVVFPDGSVYLIKQIEPQEIKPGNVVLFFTADRAGIMSGFVSSISEGILTLNDAAGNTIDVPAADIVGRYENAIKGWAKDLDTLQSPISISVFSAVLISSIILWRVLPSRKPEFDGLSASDGEISSILY